MAFEKELQAYQDNLSKLLSEAHCREINPFRGLAFFDFEHAPFFHGRTKAVEGVLDVLQQQVADKKPFVLVLGPGGSGKTSLVKAGILPVLTQTGITGENGSWRLALTRPAGGGAGDPFDALATALLKESALPEFPDAGMRNGWQNLAAELREAPEHTALRLRETLQYLSVQALDHLLDEQRTEVPPPNSEASVELPRRSKLRRVDSNVRLALVVDQLEELFVGGFSPELQQRYIAALGALVKWRVAFVIAALRSDFYTAFQECCRPKDSAVLSQPELRVRDFDLSEVLTGRFDLHPPGPQEIGEMIRLPAEAAGLRFELDPETGRSLDAALLEAATANAEPLPLLEHLLWQLYRKQLPRKEGLLRWSDYRELGELEGALANHAESVLSALDADAQPALKPVIRQLVSPGLGEEGVLIRRTVPCRDLVSTTEFSESQKAGAERLIDRFIKEGLFHAETGPNAEVLVSVTQECLLRNWPRVWQLLNEDPGLLRMRDRLERNFKLWLSRGRRGHDLLRAGPVISEAETLLRSFRTSLSDSQVGYLQKSLKAKNRRHWLRGAAALGVVAGLVAPVVMWLNANIERRKAEQSSRSEGQIAHSPDTTRESLGVGQRQQGNSAQLPQGNAALATSQRDALQGPLNDNEARAQQIQNSLELAISQRDGLQSRLKDTEAKAQRAQKDASLATSQREALQSQLSDTEAKAQQAQKNVELVTSQRDALQSQLKELTQKNADLPADQRDALQTRLNDAEARAQQVQKKLELAIGQRDALQGQLKDTEAKAQQTQKDATLAAGQRDALQSQLNDTETKVQQVQKNAELATSQRDDLQNQLKDTETRAQQAERAAALAAAERDKLQSQLKGIEAKGQEVQRDGGIAANQRDALQSQVQHAQKDAALAASQRDALQVRLTDAEARAQQAQKNVDVAISERDALQAQLKDTEAKAQQSQKDAALAASQRDALQAQAKESESKAQETQKNTGLVAREHDALQAQLRDIEAKAQVAQKNAELATSQRDTLQGQLKDTETKAQEVQKNADLATSQRDALQDQLKDTRARAQQIQKSLDLVTSQRDALQNQLRDTEVRAQQVQKNAALAGSERDGLQSQLKDTGARAQQIQKSLDLVTSQRDALQNQLRDTAAKAQQVQKNAELVAAQPRAGGGPSNGEPAQKNSAFSANRTESEQNPPPSAGLKAEPLASTQPLGSSIQPAQTTAMSSPPSVRPPAAAEVRTEGSRGSAEATVGDQQPMKRARTDQSNAALPQPTPTPVASVNPPLAQAQADKSAPDDAVDEAAVKQFVLEYIRTVTNDDVSAQERFFAQRVNFYGEGVLPLQRVQASNERYRREWPNRDWQPQGEPEILHSANSKQYEVLQPITWKVSNGAQHAEGSATLHLRIQKNTKGEFHIVLAQHSER